MDDIRIHFPYPATKITTIPRVKYDQMFPYTAVDVDLWFPK